MNSDAILLYLSQMVKAIRSGKAIKENDLIDAFSFAKEHIEKQDYRFEMIARAKEDK